MFCLQGLQLLFATARFQAPWTTMGASDFDIAKRAQKSAATFARYNRCLVRMIKAARLSFD
jgi:hypothetical protein